MTPFDALETRSEEAREAALFDLLRAQIAQAKDGAPYWAQALAGADPEAIASRADLAQLPLLRKSDLAALQEAEPPFAGTTAGSIGTFPHLFLSPGPIAEPEPRAPRDGRTHWRMERALHAAGFEAGDRVANCFSYHLTPAGFMFDRALGELGCAVFPGGVGASETQAQAMRRFRLNGYVGTPDFLEVILDKADEVGAPVTSMEKALVTAGPLFPALRERYQARGVRVRQCYGTAELGLVAYETDDISQGMALDEECIVEIVRPGTGEPVAPGEVGEVVVTTFSAGYPLIRFATGDLSAIAPVVEDEAGRTAQRLKGWMGRADQSAKVRGMFIHPSQVAAAIKGFPDIAKARLEITETEGRDAMRLLCETTAAPDSALIERVAEAAREACKLRAEVAFVAPGALPNDGKVIDDRRAPVA